MVAFFSELTNKSLGKILAWLLAILTANLFVYWQLPKIWIIVPIFIGFLAYQITWRWHVDIGELPEEIIKEIKKRDRLYVRIIWMLALFWLISTSITILVKYDQVLGLIHLILGLSHLVYLRSSGWDSNCIYYFQSF